MLALTAVVGHIKRYMCKLMSFSNFLSILEFVWRNFLLPSARWKYIFLMVWEVTEFFVWITQIEYYFLSHSMSLLLCTLEAKFYSAVSFGIIETNDCFSCYQKCFPLHQPLTFNILLTALKTIHLFLMSLNVREQGWKKRN